MRPLLVTDTHRVLVSEGVCFGRGWRHYFIAWDGGATLIEMEPAMFSGWKIARVSEQRSTVRPDGCGRTYGGGRLRC